MVYDKSNMARNVKLDLHTHPIEALREKMGIKGIGNINRAVAEEIVKAIKSAGVDGIAITECDNFNHGWVASLEIIDHFAGERLIVLPGTELQADGEHYLQIFIPERYRRRIPFFRDKEWFWILAQPGPDQTLQTENLSVTSLDAIETETLSGSFPGAQEIARTKNLPLIKASGANRLEDIGKLYLECEWR